MSNQIQHINPDGLSKNPVFSQIVTTRGNGKTVYIGGQDAVNSKGEIVGKGDIATQTEQVMKNLQIALSACGGTFENLVKLSIFVVQGQDMRSGFRASQKFLGNLTNPPAIFVLIVSGLANPDFLVEMEATAFIPEQNSWRMEKTKVVGQTKDAGFQIGVRKTFAVPIGTVWNFLFSGKGLSTWLGKISLENFELGKRYKTEEEIEGKVNVLKPNSHIRLTWKPKHWTNTSALQIRVIPSKEKTTISFHQDKLLDSKQRDEMKKYWDKVIEKIENEISN